MSYRTLDSIDKDIAVIEKARRGQESPGKLDEPSQEQSQHLPEQQVGPMIHEVSPNDFILDEKMFTIKPPTNTVKILMIYAPWCGACNQAKPLWNQLASHIPQVTFAQLNGDQYPDFIQRIGVKGFPTFVGFKGSYRAVYKGRRDAESFVTFLNSLIQS